MPVVATSASPRCLDGGDVDLLHRHHRIEGTLGLTATTDRRDFSAIRIGPRLTRALEPIS
jgi:hypothetical protein